MLFVLKPLTNLTVSQPPAVGSAVHPKTHSIESSSTTHLDFVLILPRLTQPCPNPYTVPQLEHLNTSGAATASINYYRALVPCLSWAPIPSVFAALKRRLRMPVLVGACLCSCHTMAVPSQGLCAVLSQPLTTDRCSLTDTNWWSLLTASGQGIDIGLSTGCCPTAQPIALVS